MPSRSSGCSSSNPDMRSSSSLIGWTSGLASNMLLCALRLTRMLSPVFRFFRFFSGFEKKSYSKHWRLQQESRFFISFQPKINKLGIYGQEPLSDLPPPRPSGWAVVMVVSSYTTTQTPEMMQSSPSTLRHPVGHSLRSGYRIVKLEVAVRRGTVPGFRSWHQV